MEQVNSCLQLGAGMYHSAIASKCRSQDGERLLALPDGQPDHEVLQQQSMSMQRICHCIFPAQLAQWGFTDLLRAVEPAALTDKHSSESHDLCGARNTHKTGSAPCKDLKILSQAYAGNQQSKCSAGRQVVVARGYAVPGVCMWDCRFT